MINVLFVCMGNICRSPTAHAVMQHKIDLRNLGDTIKVDSAGTHAYHVGEQSDERSRAQARLNGIDMELSLIHISDPRDKRQSRMPSSA